MSTHVSTPDGWNKEVLRRKGSFLQSWEWGQFQKDFCDIVRLRGEDGILSLWLKGVLPFGRPYWYCPRGPLGSFRKDDEAFKGATFLRVEPSVSPEGARKVASVQPAQTLVLDLSKSEEQLLKKMHPKTRYNIGVAERKGVRVYHAGKDLNAVQVFCDLTKETSGRGRFSAHDAAYYRKMLETLPFAELVFAEHDGKVLAANLMIRFGGTATYLHGASSSTQRDVMAPYLLHWTLIKEAKAAGLTTYDFWGVAPEDAPPSHPWAGVTRFKRGWGGTYITYPGTFEIPLDPFWYGLYALAKKLRSR